MITSEAADLKSPQKLSDNHSVFIGICNQYSNLLKVIDDNSDSNQSKDKHICREQTNPYVIEKLGRSP